MRDFIYIREKISKLFDSKLFAILCLGKESGFPLDTIIQFANVLK